MSSDAKSPWKNKTALVCGASAGLGLQLAHRLAGHEAKVLIVGRDRERLDAAQQQITAKSPNVRLFTFAGDLCEPSSAKTLSKEIQAKFPQLDLVINAIGQSDRGSIDSLTCERMLELVRTNVGSGLHVVQNFSPLLKSTQGSLVLIGSLSSHFAPRFLGGYSVAKHGLAALAQQSRLELAESGVHVMLASPGPIARDDAGERYNNLPNAAELPAEALKSGGGAKVKGLDPAKLAEEILKAAHHRRPTLILPRKARLLHIASALSPRLGEYLLRKFTS